VLFSADPKKAFSVELLLHRTHADLQTLVFAINDLIREGVVERFLTIRSPQTGVGFGEYKSVVDVPDHVVDQSTGDEIEVGLDEIRQYFRST